MQYGLEQVDQESSHVTYSDLPPGARSHLSLLPGTVASAVNLTKPLCLLMWPKYHIFLTLIAFTSQFSTTLVNISLFAVSLAKAINISFSVIFFIWDKQTIIITVFFHPSWDYRRMELAYDLFVLSFVINYERRDWAYVDIYRHKYILYNYVRTNASSMWKCSLAFRTLLSFTNNCLAHRQWLYDHSNG